MKSKKEIGLDFIKNNINNFICPYCKNSLELNETSLKCHSNHTFDLTKKGTINFIASTKIKESKIYNEKLFTCRRKFIQKGYYEEVYNIIVGTINSLNLNNLSNSNKEQILFSYIFKNNYKSGLSILTKFRYIIQVKQITY